MILCMTPIRLDLFSHGLHGLHLCGGQGGIYCGYYREEGSKQNRPNHIHESLQERGETHSGIAVGPPIHQEGEDESENTPCQR